MTSPRTVDPSKSSRSTTSPWPWTAALLTSSESTSCRSPSRSGRRRPSKCRVAAPRATVGADVSCGRLRLMATGTFLHAGEGPAPGCPSLLEHLSLSSATRPGASQRGPDHDRHVKPAAVWAGCGDEHVTPRPEARSSSPEAVVRRALVKGVSLIREGVPAEHPTFLAAPRTFCAMSAPLPSARNLVAVLTRQREPRHGAAPPRAPCLTVHEPRPK